VRAATWLLAGVLASSPALCAAAHAQTPPPPAAAEPADGAAAARRDPFRPFMLDLHPGPRQLLTPLQRYQLGQLTVVGTVWNATPPRALLQDSAGMGYIVTLGTPIGPDGGVVAAIAPDGVTVEQRVLDFYGKEQVKRIVLEIPKEEGPNSQYGSKE
jgi:Tfp pilus assembly protein PilP